MNGKNIFDDSIFVPYDDNNIEHVMAGPDYGQPGSSSALTELDSLEYPDYVSEVEQKILNFSILKITKL